MPYLLPSLQDILFLSAAIVVVVVVVGGLIFFLPEITVRFKGVREKESLFFLLLPTYD